MRAEYEREHLAEDIAFVSATKTERSPLVIRQDGNVAWTTATSKTTGTFKGRKIDSTGVELIVPVTTLVRASTTEPSWPPPMR